MTLEYCSFICQRLFSELVLFLARQNRNLTLTSYNIKYVSRHPRDLECRLSYQFLLQVSLCFIEAVSISRSHRSLIYSAEGPFSIQQKPAERWKSRKQGYRGGNIFLFGYEAHTLASDNNSCVTQQHIFHSEQRSLLLKRRSLFHIFS